MGSPAYAGKSNSSFIPKCFWQDHPRLCGEKYKILSIIALIKGSPPPMRGKVFAFSSIFICGRITPAYAGKSWDTSKF